MRELDFVSYSVHRRLIRDDQGVALGVGAVVREFIYIPRLKASEIVGMSETELVNNTKQRKGRGADKTISPPIVPIYNKSKTARVEKSTKGKVQPWWLADLMLLRIACHLRLYSTSLRHLIAMICEWIGVFGISDDERNPFNETFIAGDVELCVRILPCEVEVLEAYSRKPHRFDSVVLLHALLDEVCIGQFVFYATKDAISHAVTDAKEYNAIVQRFKGDPLVGLDINISDFHKRVAPAFKKELKR